MCLRLKGRSERVVVNLLDDRTLSYSFTRYQKAQELFDSVYSHLSLEETDYFGFSFTGGDGLQQWLEPDKLLLKQLPDVGKDEHRVQFRVRFYAPDPTTASHELTRYLFYLQIKRDISKGKLKIPERKITGLFAYILQAELGDFDPKRDTIGYASEFHLFPKQTEQMELAASRKHMTLQGMPNSHAELQVLNRVKWLDTYGLEYYPVLGSDHKRYRFGFTPTGLIVFKKDLVICEYFWPRLRRCWYRHQNLYIRVLSDKENKAISKPFVFQSEKRAKLTWKQCMKYRSFFSCRMSESAIRKERRRIDSSFSSMCSGRMKSFTESVASVPTFEPPVERVQSARRTRRSYSVDVTEVTQDKRKHRSEEKKPATKVSKTSRIGDKTTYYYQQRASMDKRSDSYKSLVAPLTAGTNQRHSCHFESIAFLSSDSIRQHSVTSGMDNCFNV